MSNCAGCVSKNPGEVSFHDFYVDEIYTWCPGCGNYAIHAAMKRALVELGIAPKDTLMIFDIGCHGNGADKINAYTAHGLHGRAIPLATGAALANRRQKVICFAGDGGTFGEGLVHLTHSILANYDITFVLHNNRNYGLTKGQASSTTPQGTKMNGTPHGVFTETINPSKFVLGLNPSYVARGFSGYVKHLTKLFVDALEHKGFSFVEVFQDCPTYNKATPHEWYMERVFDLDRQTDYDHTSIEHAYKFVDDKGDKIAIGKLYQDTNRKDYFSMLPHRAQKETELVDEVFAGDITKIVESYK